MVEAEILKNRPSRGGRVMPVEASDFAAKSALFLPKEAQYDYLLNLPDDIASAGLVNRDGQIMTSLGEVVNNAMALIEEQSDQLTGVLPESYTDFSDELLSELLRIFNNSALDEVGGDIIGRIYEYFLNKFAKNIASDDGVFFTPKSLVKMIVNIIEPQSGILLDDGVSGTGTARRNEFRRMIEAAENGEIDIILTKSIQRFARNTVDLLETVRHLKDIDVEVRFEKEHINSMSGDGELMLTILASFAQEESRSISDNVKWGTRKRFERGIPNGHFQIYGYRWEDDYLVIEPEEAKIVRLIYDNFLNGLSAEATEKQLEEMRVKSYKGMHFSNSSIRQILSNITYTGNLLFQKEYVSDPITGKSKINRGELPQYFVEDTHEAIIPIEIYRAVQKERERRRELGALANTHEGIVTQEEFDRANGNMRSVVQGRKREPANKGNYSVIVCPHCGLTLRPGTQKESILYCPTGRMHRESPCSRVRMRKALAEDTLVRLVRKQAELLLEAEKVLKGRKGKEPGADAGSLRAELRRLDEAKISGYEDYKAGRMSRERFVERKRELDIRRQEVSAAVLEAEAREAVEESGKREYREALGIREYLHLEGYDKRVMASLIESAKVMGEDRLEVVWKFGDVYEKILGEMR